MSMMRIIGVLLTVLSFAIILGFVIGSLFKNPYGNIAVINLHGVIGQSDLFTTGVDPVEVVNNLKEAELNPLIKAVILDIDSGGGTVVGSAIIMERVLNMSKPVIALVRDAGASGAYWIASACDKIVAHRFSMLGSIGVSSSYLDFSGLLERYNVSYVNLSIPEYKDMLSPYKEPTSGELSLMLDKLQNIYDYFVESVASNRNIQIDEMRVIADGRIYLGYEAIDLGLIDVLGSDDEAINLAVELGSIDEPVLVAFEEKADIFDLISQYMKSINPLGAKRTSSINV